MINMDSIINKVIKKKGQKQVYKTITKKLKESRDGVPKSIQTKVVRMVTKVKGRPYFFVTIKRLIKFQVSGK